MITLLPVIMDRDKKIDLIQAKPTCKSDQLIIPKQKTVVEYQ